MFVKFFAPLQRPHCATYGAYAGYWTRLAVFRFIGGKNAQNQRIIGYTVCRRLGLAVWCNRWFMIGRAIAFNVFCQPIH